MSEYTPITDELRERIEQAEHIIPLSSDSKDTQVRINLAWLKEKLDAIDSIHAQLERENEALRSSAAHAYASGYEYAEQDRDGWMELPRDADGVPIRVGDKLRYVDEDIECAAITPKRVYFWREHEMRWTPGINCRHYVSDTWESIIYDAMQAGRTDITVDVTPLIQRCKALCERTKEDA